MSDRPTQAMRREQTVSRLLDATEAVIHERGYAATTVAAICEVAGLSQGALFRHFPHRRALLVATAARVAARHTAVQVDDLRHDDLLGSLRAVRERVRSRPNQVWHELVRAARTDPALRADLAPALRDYHRTTGVAAASLLATPDSWTPQMQTALRIAINYLDGEAAVAQVLPDPARDDATLAMVADLIAPLFITTPTTSHHLQETS